MTAQSDFEEARKRISEWAKLEKFDEPLVASLSDLSDLRELPPEISEIKTLGELDLSGTDVSDLTPITSLPALRALDVSGTRVTDLYQLLESKGLEILNISRTKVRNLLPLIELGGAGKRLERVTFDQTSATQLDSKLSQISEIRDHEIRITTLVEYLRSLNPIESADRLSGKKNKVIASVSGSIPQDLAALRKQAGEVENRLHDLEKGLEKLNNLEVALRGGYDRLGEQRETLHTRYLKLEAKFASALADVQKKLSDEATVLEGKFSANLAAAEKAFTEAQSVREPAKLWRMKKKIHQTSRDNAYKRYKWGLIAVGALALLTAVLLVSAPDFVEKALAPSGCDHSVDPKLCQGFSSRGFLLIGSILTLFTVLLWFVRLQMKIYLAERHMVLDAREREAFTRSYIGLVREGDVSEEAREQRALVYSALFRPASDGTVRDEGGLDPSVAAAISKLLSGK